MNTYEIKQCSKCKTTKRKSEFYIRSIELNTRDSFCKECRRKMNFIKDIPRYTITYCQYGDKRMKPTDIFTNYQNPNFKSMCHNGDSCHESAPRGSKTGTQGLKKVDRSRIPEQFCDYIVEICEKGNI